MWHDIIFNYMTAYCFFHRQAVPFNISKRQSPWNGLKFLLVWLILVGFPSCIAEQHLTFENQNNPTKLYLLSSVPLCLSHTQVGQL